MNEHLLKFQEVLHELDVPSEHRAGHLDDVVWFLQEGIARNQSHPRILSAIYHASHVYKDSTGESFEDVLHKNHIN